MSQFLTPELERRILAGEARYRIYNAGPAGQVNYFGQKNSWGIILGLVYTPFARKDTQTAPISSALSGFLAEDQRVQVCTFDNGANRAQFHFRANLRLGAYYDVTNSNVKWFLGGVDKETRPLFLPFREQWTYGVWCDLETSGIIGTSASGLIQNIVPDVSGRSNEGFTDWLRFDQPSGPYVYYPLGDQFTQDHYPGAYSGPQTAQDYTVPATGNPYFDGGLVTADAVTLMRSEIHFVEFFTEPPANLRL